MPGCCRRSGRSCPARAAAAGAAGLRAASPDARPPSAAGSQPLRIDRLGQIVVSAVLDRLDRGLDRALRGQQDERDVDS